MRRLWPIALALLATACENRASNCPTGAVCAAPTPEHAEVVTPVALDPDRPQPPPPTPIDVSRTQERAPRGGE